MFISYYLVPSGGQLPAAAVKDDVSHNTKTMSWKTPVSNTLNDTPHSTHGVMTHTHDPQVNDKNVIRGLKKQNYYCYNLIADTLHVDCAFSKKDCSHYKVNHQCSMFHLVLVNTRSIMVSLALDKIPLYGRCKQRVSAEFIIINCCNHCRWCSNSSGIN